MPYTESWRRNGREWRSWHERFLDFSSCLQPAFIEKHVETRREMLGFNKDPKDVIGVGFHEEPCGTGKRVPYDIYKLVRAVTHENAGAYSFWNRAWRSVIPGIEFWHERFLGFVRDGHELAVHGFPFEEHDVVAATGIPVKHFFSENDAFIGRGVPQVLLFHLGQLDRGNGFG